MNLPPPPPPPSFGRPARSSLGHKAVCKYGKDCYNKSPAHLEKFAHPWLDEAAGEGPPSTSPSSVAGRHPRSPASRTDRRPSSPETAAAAMRRIGTPPRVNDVLPESTPTPPRRRSPTPDHEKDTADQEDGPKETSPAPLPGSLGSRGAPADGTSAETKKPACKYGKACKRANPKHFEEFWHPPMGEEGVHTPSAAPPAEAFAVPAAPEAPSRFSLGPERSSAASGPRTSTTSTGSSSAQDALRDVLKARRSRSDIKPDDGPGSSYRGVSDSKPDGPRTSYRGGGGSASAVPAPKWWAGPEAASIGGPVDTSPGAKSVGAWAPQAEDRVDDAAKPPAWRAHGFGSLVHKVRGPNICLVSGLKISVGFIWFTNVVLLIAVIERLTVD